MVARVLVAALFASTVLAFKSHDFKTCSQSAFCRRGRALSARAAESSDWKSPYTVLPDSIFLDGSRLVAGVRSTLYPDIIFELDVRIHEDGVARVRMDQKEGLRKRYDEAASWALAAEPKLGKDNKWSKGKKDIKMQYGDNLELRVAYTPLHISLLRDGREEVVLNGRGLLHMEHFRLKATELAISDDDEAQKVIKPSVSAWFEGEEEDGFWEEQWSTWTDSKPKGPESLSLDVDFPRHSHLYGIPQHATRLSLPSTTGESPEYEDPYRLWNSDVFEYLASSPVSLYGSIPLLHAHSKSSTVAVFNAVGSETWIDIGYNPSRSHWISESGILDVFILPGPTPEAVFAQYARLTGTVAMPAQWSLGYHQCRWNYLSSTDVRDVQKRMDEEDFPMDVLWLDIEYAEDHKYFIWDKKNFPDPVDMIKDVEALGRHMVVIVDPHLKRVDDYPVYAAARDKGVLIKTPSGNDYEGWCWSGSSAWVDFFHPESWEWWKSLFKVDSGKGWHWSESTVDTGIWNDMNEPSIFNGPEISMQRDSLHYGGWEHRDLHNINGMLFHNLTAQAAKERTTPHKRPFVLTRSFYAGSQRISAMWTGDNLGTWEHMAAGVYMTLSNNVGGMVFAGADIGGFFGNPDPEMLVRWYQVGIFAPFLRAHAHIDTKRREPYLLEEPYKSIVRDTLRLRYSMLPLWYTAFRDSAATGLPIMRPQYVMFPQDDAGFAIDEQYFLGSSGVLVRPVTDAGATEAKVYLADDQVTFSGTLTSLPQLTTAQIYYDYFTHATYRSRGKYVTVPAALHQIPVLIRGGSIVSTRERLRRSSPLMRRDPFTLRIALNTDGNAKGQLYLDDGETYAHEKGEYVWRAFDATSSGKTLSISSQNAKVTDVTLSDSAITDLIFNPRNAFANSVRDVRVEKIVVLGLSSKPSSIRVEADGSSRDLQFTWKDGLASNKKRAGSLASVLTVKDPGVPIAADWSISVRM